MIKLCQLRKQGQFRMDQSAGQQQQQQQQQTFLPRSAVHSLGAAPARQQQFGRSGAAVIMPATQQPARTGQLAMRAKLSPAMSLFNRLDGFVLQLESSRDFFAHWPDQICHRIRSPAKITSSSNEQQQQRTTTIMNANQLAGESEVGSQQQQQPQNGSSAVCWTGQNFGSYTKKLVEFGKTNMQDHPEVPVGQPTRVNEMILTSIERIRSINDQLIRQSTKSPLPAVAAQYLGGPSRARATKSGDLRRTISSAPLVPQARVSSELLAAETVGQLLLQQQQQQQQPAQLDLMMMAQSVQNEAHQKDAIEEPEGDESNIDESSATTESDDSSDEDEEDDEANSDPCDGDRECANQLESNSNNNEPTTDEFNTLQQQMKPPINVATEEEQQATRQHFTQRIPQQSRFPAQNHYPTPTVSWEQSTVYGGDLSSDNRQSSSASQGHFATSSLLLLLAVSSTWLNSRQRITRIIGHR